MPLRSASRPDPRANALLAAARSLDFARLAPFLTVVSLPAGRSLSEPGQANESVHFPASCVIAMTGVTRDGLSIQTAVAGREGVVDPAVAMGIDHTALRAVVQNGGTAYRAPAPLVRRLFDASPSFRSLLVHYAHLFMVQMSQSAVCNRHHTLEQQFCRWILSTLDRLDGSTISMTHEFVAGLLGVRREGVSEAAAHLREAQLIDYRRRRVLVLDRTGIEARVCECYAIVNAEQERFRAACAQSAEV